MSQKATKKVNSSVFILIDIKKPKYSDEDEDDDEESEDEEEDELSSIHTDKDHNDVREKQGQYKKIGAQKAMK